MGGFKRHLFDGQGRYEYANGDRYDGPWRHGQKHGASGTFSRASDGTTLVVDWVHDRAHGRGRCTYGNGATFVGDYRNDAKEGTGMYTAPNGDEYHGEFQNDKIMGKGRFVDRKNGTSYVGTFKNSRRLGRLDPAAQFTLHHGLFGDFAFTGAESFGEKEPPSEEAPASPASPAAETPYGMPADSV